MTIKLPSDHAARAAAIDPSHSFLVQAPAGSGKTELLTDRILALLAVVSRPEEIVAITFTRKAASEMHARVLSKLQAGDGPRPLESYKIRSWELAQAAMQRNRELGWNLLEYPARLSIRTIDSFCAQLVRSMPWLSSLGGMPGITENAEELYLAAAQATLDEIEAAPFVAAFVEHLDIDLALARRLLASMLASRDQWLPVLYQGTDANALMHNLDVLISDELRMLAEKMPPGWSYALGPCLSKAANVLAAKSPGSVLQPLEFWRGEPFDTTAQSVAAWQALAAALLTGSGGLRKTVTIAQGFEAKSAYKEEFLAWLVSRSADEPWVQALARVRDLPTTGYTPDQQETVGVLLRVLHLAAAHLMLQFAERAEVDFIEIAQRALQALGHDDAPSDLLLALDASVRHILVDEFQDTSETQIALLQRLTSGWQAGDGRSLFLVGDPMQSIYRFRKADVGGFLRVKASGIGHLPLVSLELKDNFRSQADLVHWVNQTCGPVFPADDLPDLGAISYTPSQAFNAPDPQGGVQFHPVWVHSDASDDDDPSQQAETLVVELARQALQHHAGSKSPVAILVRARSHLEDIVRRLVAEKIPCRAVELVTLRSRPVVSDLVQLARALSHAGDRLAWLSVLRSPLCGLTLTSLHAVFGSNHAAGAPALLQAWMQRDAAGEAGLRDDEARRLRYAAQVLLDRGNDSGRLPFAAWLERQWQRLGGPAVYATDSDNADVEQVLRLIEKLAPYGGLDPVVLDQWLDRLYAAPGSAEAAVDVMTIHKSKGLEFETVILAGLHRVPRSDTAPLLRFERSEGRLVLGPIKSRSSGADDPISVYLASRESRRAAFEADRLLYVALTRARNQLHLVGQVRVDEEGRIKSPPSSSLLGRLWNYMHVPEQASVPAMRSDASLVPLQAGSVGQSCLVRRQIDTLPSELAGEPESVVTNQPWQWRSQTDDEAVIGTVAHAWLERIGKEGIETWTDDRLAACLPAMRRQLSRAGLVPEALDGGQRVLLETLRATLASETGRWLLGVARAYREWSLLDIEGRVCIIDLAISRENDWLVVDYKTGVPHADEPLERFKARMLERYGPQLEHYCEHVSALDGRSARGALYFPRADLWIEAQAADHNSC